MYSVKSDYLFVYSSLLQGFPTPDYDYVSRYFDFVGPARTRGRLSILHNIVVGTPVHEGEEFILGELYKIRETDQFSFAIGQLDEYEGIHPEPPAHPLYRRTITAAVLEDGSTVDAWVYWYNGAVGGLPKIESGNVLDFLRGRS